MACFVYFSNLQEYYQIYKYLCINTNKQGVSQHIRLFVSLKTFIEKRFRSVNSINYTLFSRTLIGVTIAKSMKNIRLKTFHKIHVLLCRYRCFARFGHDWYICFWVEWWIRCTGIFQCNKTDHPIQASEFRDTFSELFQGLFHLVCRLHGYFQSLLFSEQVLKDFFWKIWYAANLQRLIKHFCYKLKSIMKLIILYGRYRYM